jgi:hypothetical protein
VKGLLIVCAMVACAVTTGFACWQTETPKTVLPTKSLNLRVTHNDKAEKDMKFELHKAITFDIEEARQLGAYDRKSLKSATTDSQGLLSFGEVKPARYWIVPKGGTLGSSIAVEVISPRAVAAKRVWLNYFADGCLDVVVEAAF